jgi:hypothetical protein
MHDQEPDVIVFKPLGVLLLCLVRVDSFSDSSLQLEDFLDMMTDVRRVLVQRPVYLSLVLCADA